MAKKTGEGFNTPFQELKAKVKAPAAPAAAKAPTPPATTKAQAPPPPTRAPADSKQRAPAAAVSADDQRLFEQAMRGVVPLSASDRTRRAATAPASAPSRVATRAHARREDALAEADLADLVAGPGRLTVEEAGEIISGRAAGIDRRLLKRLRDGEYAVDGEIDLHGQTREQAIAALDRTLRRAATDGRRAVLVIHGRGLNSGADGPVLKDAVKRALSEGPLTRLVLAFTSAPAERGGPGATLVLLRKPGR